MSTHSNDLTNLPNIGSTLAGKLNRVGISTPGDLNSAGSENTMIRIKTVDKEACLNMLYALEGAIQGKRWHDLDENRKAELKDFFNQLK